MVYEESGNMTVKLVAMMCPSWNLSIEVSKNNLLSWIQISKMLNWQQYCFWNVDNLILKMCTRKCYDHIMSQLLEILCYLILFFYGSMVVTENFNMAAMLSILEMRCSQFSVRRDKSGFEFSGSLGAEGDQIYHRITKTYCLVHIVVWLSTRLFASVKKLFNII